MKLITDDEELLRHVARAARERSQAGQTSEEEWDARADRVLAGYEEEAFGAGFQAAVVDRIRQRIVAPGAEPAPRRSSEASGPRWRLSRPALALAASLLLAAVALAWILGGPGGSAAPLPTYTLAAAGTLPERSSSPPPSSPPVAAVPGFRFELRLRPARSPAGPVALRVFAADGGGRLLRWREAEGQAEVLASGVILLDGLQEEDWRPLEAGSWKLYLAVGRPGTLPSLEELRALLGGGGAPDPARWQLLVQEFRLAPAP